MQTTNPTLNSSAESVDVAPITERASGLIELPEKKTDRALIEDALALHYGSNQ